MKTWSTELLEAFNKQTYAQTDREERMIGCPFVISSFWMAILFPVSDRCQNLGGGGVNYLGEFLQKPELETNLIKFMSSGKIMYFLKKKSIKF